MGAFRGGELKKKEGKEELHQVVKRQNKRLGGVLSKPQAKRRGDLVQSENFGELKKVQTKGKREGNGILQGDRERAKVDGRSYFYDKAPDYHQRGGGEVSEGKKVFRNEDINALKGMEFKSHKI